jgi:outer membrane protein OmpA-like peptidoglycan-associated protein
MRKHLFVSLFLPLAMVLPARTQQATTNTSANDATSQNANDLPPLTSPKSKDFWDGDDPNVVNLIAHPFANKKYVQRQVGPIRDRLNELDQITSENSKKIREVDANAQQGIKLASEKSDVADQHASDAASKAQLAGTAANDATTHVTSAEQMVASLDQYKGSAQTEIRFRPGQTVLSKSAKDALDQMAGSLKDQHSYVIEVRGFAPGQGQSAIRSSEKMAESVVRYLVLNHQIPVYRIYELSMGNAQVEGGDKHASSARVEVNVLQNEQMGAMQR